MTVAVVRAITLLAFFLLWEITSVQRWVDPIFIGQPTRIAVFLYEGLLVNYVLIHHTVWTLIGTLTAFGLGSICGILFGLMFVAYPAVEKFFEPIFNGLNALPRIALAPLFLLWFGLGLPSKVALGFSLTFFIVLSSTVAGARSVNPDFLTLAHTLGAKSTVIFRKITLPSAVPTVFSGLRLGLIYALLGVIAAEIIAAEQGLGQKISFLAGTFQINGVFAVLFLLGLIGASLTWIASAMERRLLRWR